MPNFICSICGTIADPIRITKGSFLVELGLWFFFLVPGLIYSLWRLTTKFDACPQCKNSSMIPISSPVGKKLLNEQSQPLNISPTMAIKKSDPEIGNLAANYINKMTSKK